MAEAEPGAGLELWGGIECTVTRIGDIWRDQVKETGHHERPADLDAIARLGIRRLRYPVLWESVSPDTSEDSRFSWHDERLGRLQQLGVEVIAGLLHHGSGPHYTSLLDPEFPELFAEHAWRVAQRYPWVKAFTPVNEPLTTARFSCLYGHWYPHRKSTSDFLRALVIQAKATVLAMRAIRRITPGAQLVQTEDLGKTFSTPVLRRQAKYENERRWLSFDLLMGHVDARHFFWREFIEHGIAESDLSFFLDNPLVPDIIGINHYATSERYLDERTELYPEEFRGGNSQCAYADVEAVRIEPLAGQTGPEARLKEVWERYRRPIAVTEAHHGCSRDEQLRWLMEVWIAAAKLKAGGANILAVTAWSLLGAVDWNSLLVRRDGHYEPGAFDVRSTPPRKTAIGMAVEALGRLGRADHPSLDDPGWWKRSSRFYSPRRRAALQRRSSSRPLMITGATGTLGRALSRVCMDRGLEHVILTRQQMDIADHASVDSALRTHRPWAVINAAGYVRPADEATSAQCFRENAAGPAVLAEACSERRLPFTTFSSDLVFDGSASQPYVETDPISPRCVYGASKAEAERRVLERHPHALIVRTSAFFGPWDRYNFVFHALTQLAAGRTLVACDRTLVSPTYVPDLAHCVLDLQIDSEMGVWHLASQGVISWFALAEAVAGQAGLDLGLLQRAEGTSPCMTALSSGHGNLMPSLERGIQRYLRESEIDWRHAKATVDSTSVAAGG